MDIEDFISSMRSNIEFGTRETNPEIWMKLNRKYKDLQGVMLLDSRSRLYTKTKYIVDVMFGCDSSEEMMLSSGLRQIPKGDMLFALGFFLQRPIRYEQDETNVRTYENIAKGVVQILLDENTSVPTYDEYVEG
jgi:hypothetical protein